MRRFKEIKVWQKSRELTKAIYELTRHFPREERYGLISQLRRAAVSIMSNIAEGSRKATPRDQAHYLNMAEGSAAEIDSLLVVSGDQHFVEEATAAHHIELVDEISRMLYSFRKRIQP